MALKEMVESKRFEQFIVFLIACNAVTLGLESSPSLDADLRVLLYRLDKLFLVIFSIEILLKLTIYRVRYFNDPWRVFDFAVISLSLLPATGPLAVLRSLRVLRALRMISVVPALRRVVNGLLLAIPGLGAVATIMLLVFYVGAVIATNLFSATFPEWFGSIWASAYSLFQIMTLESWSMGIVRPVMQTYPWAWLFFLPFILITTFTMLNLFIAVIVNAMQVETEVAAQQREERGHDERTQMLQELMNLRRSIEDLQRRLPPAFAEPTAATEHPLLRAPTLNHRIARQPQEEG